MPRNLHWRLGVRAAEEPAIICVTVLTLGGPLGRGDAQEVGHAVGRSIKVAQTLFPHDLWEVDAPHTPLNDSQRRYLQEIVDTLAPEYR